MAEYADLPFAEAIAYLRAKVNFPTERWDDLAGQSHDRYWAVAGATKADLLTDLHTAVQKGLEQGTTLETFRADFERIVAKHGWTGWTGEGSPEGVAWRTNVIYGTNLRTAYAAGRRAQRLEIAPQRPWWRYRHNDTVSEPRPAHLGWDGVTLRSDDPWWQIHDTPNGWGCRCYIETLSDADLEREGITPGPAPNDGTYTYKDARTREVREIPKGIDPGWDHAPGATRDLRAELAAKAQQMPGSIGKDLVSDLDDSANGAILRVKEGGIPQAPAAGETPMTTTTEIYKDASRTLSTSDTTLLIDSANSGRRTVGLDRVTIVEALPADVVKALKGMGKDPAGWYGLKNGGQISAVMPPQTRAAVDRAIDNAKAAVAQRAEAQQAFDSSLLGQRQRLAEAALRSYSPEHFPGSPKWLANKRAVDALAAFDVAHPEIAARIEAERVAKQKAKYEALSDFVKAGS